MRPSRRQGNRGEVVGALSVRAARSQIKGTSVKKKGLGEERETMGKEIKKSQANDIIVILFFCSSQAAVLPNDSPK